MDQNLVMLCGAAVAIALTHTLCGPDHYVPFVAMSRAGKWSLRRTVIVTLLSGLGHVGSSVALGCIGIAAGELLTRLEFIEQARGRIVGWMLILFGFAYLLWGIIYWRRNQPHMHIHGGAHHSHHHSLLDVAHHDQPHTSAIQAAESSASEPPVAVRLTPWVLFTIFVFGPCEPLIPLLMYPAAQSSLSGVLLVTILFSVTTIATMLTVVLCLLQGTKKMHFTGLHSYSHALAGMIVMLCGLAINFGL
ncbi:hypothetical protein [Schlesneria paludicola]|uniref:hypothetical protein n=1 Tax=Schlesneria paludicola TaxID=360056 RepID=UPI00029B3DD9|nr:hypothetical protein [Schlesneria paludicola]